MRFIFAGRNVRFRLNPAEPAPVPFRSVPCTHATLPFSYASTTSRFTSSEFIRAAT